MLHCLVSVAWSPLPGLHCLVSIAWSPLPGLHCLVSIVLLVPNFDLQMLIACESMVTVWVLLKLFVYCIVGKFGRH